MRAIYEREGPTECTSNFWKFTRQMPKSFYNGTSRIKPLNDVIKKVLRSGYLHRIERLMKSGQLQAQQQALRVEQVRIALEAALPSSNGEATDAFRGEKRRMSFLSSAMPQFERGALRLFKLELRFDEKNQLTELWGQTQGTGTSAASSWAVHSWRGNSGEFRYIDQVGNLHDIWPPAPGLAGTLPSAIVVDPVSSEGQTWAAHPGASHHALPSRREMIQE